MAWLDNARIVAMVAVVFVHSAARVSNGTHVGADEWWIAMVFGSSVRWCVPVFVMISGALLLDPHKTEDLGTFYKKRLSRLLVPILFWSVFFLLWAALEGVLRDEPLLLTDVARSLAAGQPHYHMWFLYMIATLYLLVPFFRRVVANSSRSELTVLVVLCFVLAAINAVVAKLSTPGPRLFVNECLQYIPYFFLGYLIRTDDRSRSKLMLWSVAIASFALTVIGCYGLAIRSDFATGRYFYSYLSVTVIPMSISVMYLLKSWTKPLGGASFARQLADLTLGMYLIHPIVLETFQFLGYGQRSFYAAYSIPILALVALSLSLLAAWVVRKTPYLRRTI